MVPPRITESLSKYRTIPSALRRPSRLTFTVAAATIATAAVAGTAAAAGSAGPPPHAAAPVAAASTSPAAGPSHSGKGISPAVVSALSGQAAPVHTVRVYPPPQASHDGKAQLAAKAQPRQHAPAHPAPSGSHNKETGSDALGLQGAHRAAVRLSHPYRIYDSVTPSSIPRGEAAAVYSTGAYYTTPSQTQHLGHTLWIDTTGRNYSASVLDVEPGDATPAQAASWVHHRLSANPDAKVRVYTMRSMWPATHSAIASLPSWMQARVHWWIADPTGVPHIVPGSYATQWYWGQSYDLSLAKPGF
jgi:hypothetical protein